MGVFAWFKEWATKSNRSVPTPRHPDLHPIDVSKLAQELRLKEEAKRLGAGGIPSPDAQSLTGPESAVVQRIETYRQGYLDWAVARMNLLSMDLGKLNITAEVNRALSAAEEFERKAASLLTEHDSERKALAASARNAQRELDDFRQTHQLQREAHWPAGASAFLYYAILAVLVVVEGVVNAKFFAQGVDSGWLGGLTYAIVLALVNVGIAFSAGKWVVRFLNHRRPVHKLLGLLATFAAIGLIFSVGLGIAHYRDAMTTQVADAANSAFEALRQRPLELREIDSWILLLVSVGFGVFAMFDGYKTDDPYPGYGQISRRVQQVIGDYDAELDDLREQLAELKDTELSSLNDAVEAAQSGLAVYRARIDEKDAAAIRLATALQNAESSVAALLGEFRNENELNRNGAPRPKYFDQIPELKQLPFPDFSTASDREALAAQAQLVEILLSKVETFRAGIQDAFNNQRNLLQPLGAHF